VTDAVDGALERVSRMVREDLAIDVDDVDTDLIQTGSLDSLALVELIFQLERAFEVSISLERVDIERFGSIRQISILVDELRAASPDG
jgi:acyl carrier protein